MDKLVFYFFYTIFWVIEQVTCSCGVVKAVLTARKQYPFFCIDLHTIRIKPQSGQAVNIWLNRVGKYLEISFVFKFIKNLIHAFMHFRTNALACGKEIFYHGYLTLQVVLSNIAAILVNERKGLYITHRWNFWLPVIGSRKNKVEENGGQNNKK